MEAVTPDVILQMGKSYPEKGARDYNQALEAIAYKLFDDETANDVAEKLFAMATPPKPEAPSANYTPYVDTAFGIGAVNVHAQHESLQTPTSGRKCSTCGHYCEAWEFTTLPDGDICDGCL